MCMCMKLNEFGNKVQLMSNAFDVRLLIKMVQNVVEQKITEEYTRAFSFVNNVYVN